MAISECITQFDFYHIGRALAIGTKQISFVGMARNRSVTPEIV